MDINTARELYRKGECNEQGHLKHIFCHGARFHVTYWDSRGTHCSEPECEITTTCMI